jgi:hypothetical protein
LEDDAAEDFLNVLDEASRIDDWSEIDTEDEEDEETEMALDQDPNISGPSDDEKTERSAGGLRSAGERGDN